MYGLTVAIVGMSATPSRASHFVATYLAGKTDWTVYYVNPGLSDVLGQPVYPSLAELPQVPDLVDVFRRRDDLPLVVDEAIALAGTVGFEAPVGVRADRITADGTSLRYTDVEYSQIGNVAGA